MNITNYFFAGILLIALAFSMRFTSRKKKAHPKRTYVNTISRELDGKSVDGMIWLTVTSKEESEFYKGCMYKYSVTLFYADLSDQRIESEFAKLKASIVKSLLKDGANTKTP